MNPLLLLKILAQVGKSIGTFTSSKLSSTPELVQQIKQFKARTEIRNVLAILDFENYRQFEMHFPSTGKKEFVRVDDSCLQRSLRSYDEMMKLAQGIEALQAGHGKTIHGTDERLKEYLIEFEKEITLRDWFNRFLEGLEGFNQLIESRQTTVEGLRPFIIDWIEVIADRSKRRIGGTSFYDQLFKFIVDSGYTGATQLFEHYGYRITPPPYDNKDFSTKLISSPPPGESETDPATAKSQGLSPNLGIALSLAKAAYLSYEDHDYVKGITRDYWISNSGSDADSLSPVELAEQTLEAFFEAEEIRIKSASQVKEDDVVNYTFFEDAKTSTEGFAFILEQDIPEQYGQRKTMILSLRGTQEFLKDWNTNIKFEPTPLKDESGANPNEKVKVHSGFQDAWQSICGAVIQFVDDRKPDRILVTGHSLGGALATLATVSLKEKALKKKELKDETYDIAGLYTFGQPHVGNQDFAKYFNDELKIPAYRFVNNNDVVPRSLNAVRVYKHIGKMQYFKTNGDLQQNVKSAPPLDRLYGYIKAAFEPGVEGIYDHRMEFYIDFTRKAYLKQTPKGS